MPWPLRDFDKSLQIVDKLNSSLNGRQRLMNYHPELPSSVVLHLVS